MDGRTDERTDRQTEKLIQCGLGNLIGSSSTTSQQTSTAFLAGKKHQVFFTATMEQNIACVNLFHKPSVSFYLMAIVAIVAIHQECIIPIALFNWSIVTY